jgi:hypothetical protein
MHFIGVLNKNGGTFRTLDMAAFSANAETILSARGHSLDCRIVDGEELLGELERAALRGEVDHAPALEPHAIGADGIVALSVVDGLTYARSTAREGGRFACVLASFAVHADVEHAVAEARGSRAFVCGELVPRERAGRFDAHAAPSTACGES